MFEGNTLVSVISDKLEEGYIWFNDNMLDEFKKFAEMSVEFYESDLRGKISYPPYQLATQLIANHSLIPWMAKNGYSIDSVFPGDYLNSVETENGDYEVRMFTSNLYKNEMYVGKITFLFPHSHEDFGFISKPEVTLHWCNN